MENYNLYYRETDVYFRRLCDLVIRGQSFFWNWKITGVEIWGPIYWLLGIIYN
jgi:hypothetical protein